MAKFNAFSPETVKTMAGAKLFYIYHGASVLEPSPVEG